MSLSLSLWASLRSLATVYINVVRLSLNEKRLSWLLTLVQHSTSLGMLERSDPKPFHFLFVFQHSPEPRRQDTGLIFALRSRADVGNMSIQESFKRCKSNEKFPIQLTISTFLLPARVNL